MCDTRYKVGDRVRILQTPPLDRQSGPSFISRMEKYLGMEAVVIRIIDVAKDTDDEDYDVRYRLATVDGEPICNVWCSAYFEDETWSIENKPFTAASSETIDNFLSM